MKTPLLFLAVLVASMPVAGAELGEPPVQPRAVRKVFGDGKHNAFTALARFKGDLWLAFRTAKDHNAPDGDLIILRSRDDGKSWAESHRVDAARDDRDPQFLVLGSRLILYDQAMKGSALTCFAVETEDGKVWSEPKPVYEPAFILWKPVIHNGAAFSAAHRKDEGGGGKGREVHLVTSTDG